MKLPRVPYKLTKNMSEVIAMRGINYGDMLRDGDLRESTNLSARRYPYLSVRRGRELVDDNNDVLALTEWDGKLIKVYSDGEYASISYGGVVINDESGNPYKLTPTTKQFAVVANKLFILPDNVYVDLSKDEESGEVNPTIKEIVLSKSWRGKGFISNNKIYAYKKTGDPASVKLSNYYKPGDTVVVSNIYRIDGNGDAVSITENDGVSFTVDSVDDESWIITAKGTPFTPYSVSAATGIGSMSYILSVKFPELDYVCEYNNRLYGCSNKEQIIYVSALGDPSQLYSFEGDSGSFAVAVSADGEFTGCTRLGTSVLFWKEDKLHKLLGEYPSEYTLYSYDVDGVQKGSHKSQQVINETLYYLGAQGVYAYNGGLPTLVSESFGQRRFKNGIAGRDTDSYYLSVEDEKGGTHLLVYETHAGMWLREDDTRAKDFTRIANDLYFIDNAGEVWKMDSGEADKDVEWMAYFTPFYETMQGRKTYSKLLIRAEIPQGAYIKPEVRYDGGDWKSLPAITGGKDAKNDTVAIPIPINRCDKFELRLSGKGDVAILGMVREFMVRSDK